MYIPNGIIYTFSGMKYANKMFYDIEQKKLSIALELEILNQYYSFSLFAI